MRCTYMERAFDRVFSSHCPYTVFVVVVVIFVLMFIYVYECLNMAN